MSRLPFTKMSGAGNDFIVVDAGRLPRDRSGRAVPAGRAGPALARRLCPRRTAVGADGLILLSRERGLVKFLYFNADGSAAFCGNGSRCAALWARRRGWGGASFVLESASGPILARSDGARASVRLPDARVLRPSIRLSAGGRAFDLALVLVGVPHAVTRVPLGALPGLAVAKLGRALRRHRGLGPAGANVDFLGLSPGRAGLRTYERGVEDETLACGTGAAAAAVCASLWADRRPPVTLTAPGGRLRVDFKPLGGGRFTDVWLEGPAEEVFTGEVDP